MAQHKTLAFFIPHRGCPHQCSFCDQRTISGTVQAPTPEEVTQTCQAMLERSGSLESAEIAFFGGSLQPMAGFVRSKSSRTARSKAERQTAWHIRTMRSERPAPYCSVRR